MKMSQSAQFSSVQESKKYQMVQITLVGENYSGKTNIIQQIVNKKFSYERNMYPQIIDFKVKQTQRQGKHYKVVWWDTLGSSRFEKIYQTYLRKSQICLVVVDLTDQDKSTDNHHKNGSKAKHWCEFCRKNMTKQSLMVLVGNKADLLSKRKTSATYLRALAQEYKCTYVQISAMNLKDTKNLQNLVLNEYLQEKQKFIKRGSKFQRLESKKQQQIIKRQKNK